MAYLYLGIAIVAEVAGTAALKGSAGFTKLVPSIVVVLAYAIAFFFLALTLRTIPVGIAYAVWCGVGMALVVIAGAVLFNEIPDLPTIIGVGLILTGVVIVNTMSVTTPYSGM
jgi:small multidrug resistance pump